MYMVCTNGRSVKLLSVCSVRGSEDVIITGIPVAVALATLCSLFVVRLEMSVLIMFNP